jgi:hypothetical protein
MITAAVADAIAPANQFNSANLEGFVRNSCVIMTPTIADIVWPKKILRG